MGEKKTEVAEDKIPWLIIIPIAVLLPIVSNIIWTCQSGVYTANFSLGPAQTSIAFSGGAFLAAFLAAEIANYLKKGKGWLLSKKITYVYAAVLTTLLYSNAHMPGWWWSGINKPRLWVTEHDVFLPDWWMPPTEYVEQLYTGGATPVWGVWIGPIIFAVTLPFFLRLFFLALVNMVRRRWIVTEQLPYPYGYAPALTVQTVTAPESAESGAPRKKALFSYGFIAGFLFYLPFLLTSIFPFIPDIYGWLSSPWNPWTLGGLDLTVAAPALTQTVIGLTYLNFNPVWWCLALLAPLRFLFSFWFFWLVFGVVIPQIAYAMGYYSGIEVEGSWTRADRIGREAPLKLTAFGLMGVLPGIIIWWAILNRDHIATVFRLAMGKGSPEEKRWEQEEALSFRLNFVLLMVSVIALIAIFSVSGMEVIAGITLLTAMAINHLSNARIHGVLGFPVEDPYYQQGWFKWLYPPVETRSQSQVLAISFCGWWNADEGVAIQTMPGNESLDLYKFGDVTGARTRNIFITTIVTTLISAFVSITSLIAWWHYWGAAKLPFPTTTEWESMGMSAAELYATTPAADPWWPQALLGFITSGILTFLPTRFVWFPLDPLGLVLATQHWTYSVSGLPMAALGAWVIKSLVIRIGGAKAFSGILPVVVGLISGYAVCMMLIGAPASALRFIFPV